MTEIKPCPFCGHTCVDVMRGGESSYAYCQECDARGPSTHLEIKGDDQLRSQAAYDAWNGRIQ